MKKLFAILLCAVMFAALCVPASAAADTETGLVVYYTFDTDGTDAKGIATIADIPAERFVDGKIGKALDFTGHDCAVSANITGTVSNENGMSVAMWVKVDDGNVCEKGQTYGNSNLLGWTGAHLFIQNGTGNLGMQMTVSYPYAWNNNASVVGEEKVYVFDQGDNLSTWNHIAVVSDKTGVVTYYINGVAYTGSWGGNPVSEEFEDFMAPLTGVIYFGNWTPAGNQGFDGQVDDVRIYNRALTAEDVAALYNPTTGDDNTGDDNADTFDALTVVALVALTSTAGVVVSKKRR